jgi:hypothetical protein
MCSTFRSGGNCNNHQLAPRKELEAVVAEALRQQFITVTRSRSSTTRSLRSQNPRRPWKKSEREQLEARAKQTKAKINRLVDAIVEGGGDIRALNAKLKELEAEAGTVAARIEEIDVEAEELPPLDLDLVAATLKDTVDRLGELFNDPDHHMFHELHALVRQLIDKIVVPSSAENLPDPSLRDSWPDGRTAGGGGIADGGAERRNAASWLG